MEEEELIIVVTHNNDDNINPLESILTRNKSNHLKYQFIDGIQIYHAKSSIVNNLKL